MEKALHELLDWLGGNWGWAITVFCVFFEVAPVKLHPISAALGWLGKKLTGDIRKDLSELREDVDRQRMSSIRTTVLDFSNSCLNHHKHTKEEFDHVIAENRTYEELVKKYNVQNDVYTEAFEYIKRLYRKRMDNGDFLAVPASNEDVDGDGQPS